MVCGQILNLLGGTYIICAGGACNSVYISTLSLFFSSLGISLVDWIPILNGLGFVFILIALFSLYSAKRSVCYPPFIVGSIASLFIIMNLMGILINGW